MLSKAVAHLRGPWTGALALFLVIAGGTAYAANTIGSADVIDESLRSQDLRNDNVTGDDVLESSLRQGTTWRLVGAAGQPAFGDHPHCRWANYDGSIALPRSPVTPPGSCTSRAL